MAQQHDWQPLRDLALEQLRLAFGRVVEHVVYRHEVHAVYDSGCEGKVVGKVRLCGGVRLRLVGGVLLVGFPEVRNKLVVAGADERIPSGEMLDNGVIVRLAREVDEVAGVHEDRPLVRGKAKRLVEVGLAPSHALDARGGELLLARVVARVAEREMRVGDVHHLERPRRADLHGNAVDGQRLQRTAGIEPGDRTLGRNRARLRIRTQRGQPAKREGESTSRAQESPPIKRSKYSFHYLITPKRSFLRPVLLHDAAGKTPLRRVRHLAVRRNQFISSTGRT